MPKLTIRADELIACFEDHSPDMRHFLDRQTGEVVFLPDSLDADEDTEDLDAEPERYLLIEPVHSSAAYQVMADFVDTLPAGRAQKVLARVLQQTHPFRGFKDALLDLPPVREDWFRFHERAYMAIVAEWLQDNEVEAELVSFYQEPRQYEAAPVSADKGSATAGVLPRPLIGAEIMDDPAATPDKIDHWFRLLADHQMPLARVFIPRGEDALQRMDGFFRAAEKYQVGITATLGGPPSEENARWIQAVVRRYKDSPALDSWILMNEPGQSPDANPLALERFRAWLQAKYQSVEGLNRAWQSAYAEFDAVAFEPQWMSGRVSARPAPFLDWHTFWRSHLTWHLNWIAAQIHQVDAAHPTHVNPHALVGNLAAMSLDLPTWRGFLDSLGSSIHPSWHFTLLGRDQYALGVAYVCDLIRGAAEPKPFWVTELQGGNNTNSGNRPLCPTPADIAQWLWTGIGSGAERMVFWLLNNRSYGVESGEWSLLDFQDQPSERLEAASHVAKVLRQYPEFFRDARPVTAPITILLSLETMTLQERFEKTQPITSTERGVPVRLEGRGRNAHVLAALAYYETFQQLGIPVQVKFMHDFSWDAEATPPQLAILPNVAALAGEQAQAIEAFVRGGHSVLLTGLTGAWDPENRFWPLASGFPLADLLGATLKDLRTLDEGCEVALQSPQITLPSHLWVGEIRNVSAEPIGQQNGWTTAVRKQAGRGQAVWIPSLVDLGAWLGDNRPLARFLQDLAAPFVGQLPFRFAELQPGCLLRILRHAETYVTVITNGTLKPQTLRLLHPEHLTPITLWDDDGSIAPSGQVTLPARGTVVVLWR